MYTNIICSNAMSKEKLLFKVLRIICRRNSNSEFKHIPKRPRHIRYIEDVTRDDFTSDQAFLVVEKYYKETKNKLKLKDKNIGRLKKKVSTFEDLLDHLKEVGLISKEGLDALKVRL